MAKPIQDAYDPTDTANTQDILTTILTREKSRRKNTQEEAPAPTGEDSIHTAVQQYGNTEIQQYNNKAVFQEIPLPPAETEASAKQANTAKEAPVRSARKANTSAPNTTSTAVPQYRNTETLQYSNTEIQQYGSTSNALHQVRQMRATEVVTMRIPYELNEWLEEFVFAHRKEGFKKQEVMAWAITLLRQQIAENDAT